MQKSFLISLPVRVLSVALEPNRFTFDVELFLESFFLYKKLYICLLLQRLFKSGNGLVPAHIPPSFSAQFRLPSHPLRSDPRMCNVILQISNSSDIHLYAYVCTYKCITKDYCILTRLQSLRKWQWQFLTANKVGSQTTI